MFLHTVAIVEFGGSDDVRDRGLLEAALARPLASFAGELLYSTPFLRAAALMDSLVHERGFSDGNKRVAIMAAAFWLELEGYTLTANQDELYKTTLAMADARLTSDEIARWLEERSVRLDR